jgi:ATP-binding cassette subfamily F protein 3
VIVSKANFLLLDEPTNHLDIHSVDLLAEALNKYEGSYLLVSHDRYFISKTANKIWEIEDHKIKEFKGTYQEYVDWKERMEKQKRQSAGGRQQGNKNPDKKKDDDVATPATSTLQPVTANQPATRNQQPATSNLKELQKIQRQFQKAEEEVNKKNKRKAELELELGKPENYTDHQKFLALENEYKKIMQDLASANADYEKLFEKIMEMEAGS